MGRDTLPRVTCTFCGHIGQPKVQWRGSKHIARFLWLTLLFPGPLYNYWQWRGRKQVCAYCGSEYITPADSEETLERHDRLKKMAESEPFLAEPTPKNPRPHDDQF
ncbi:MAG: hypothetical protein FJX23_05195 [Alphaproteobacteria bacterium]|nr:hypothetical protein [Alphaproteobacteria bacterium]